jgi:hypothetical protein
MAFIFILSVASAHAEQRDVYYAGFGFVGSYADAKVNFPCSFQLLKELNSNGQPLLEEKLLSAIKEHNNPNLNLLLDTDKTGKGLSIAFGLSQESVSVEKLPSFYKSVFDIQAQITIFDFEEKKLIATYPVFVQLNDSSKKMPTSTDACKRIKQLYLTTDLNLNIFDEFVKRLDTIAIKKSYRNYLKVREIQFGEPFLLDMPNSINKESYKAFLANQFSAFLSSNQKLPILPYSKGHLIDGKMVMRMADSTEINLIMPSADYEINLSFQKLFKKKYEETPVQEAWIFASYMQLEMKVAGDSGRVLGDIAFKDMITKSVLKDEHAYDIWPVYQESLLNLMNNTTKEITNSEGKWINKQASARNISVELNLISQKLDASR